MPLVLVVLGLLVAATPAVYTLFVPLDLGPREKLVDGERHLTLTGSDRKDYSVLKLKPDVVVLQMANPDVTDQSLESLKEMKALQELDLNGTQVTDAGLVDPPGSSRAGDAAAGQDQDHRQGLPRRALRQGFADAARPARHAGQPRDAQGLARRQAGAAGLAVRHEHEVERQSVSQGASFEEATIMSMSLDDSAAGNARNALFLAKACDLAYYAEAEGGPRFRSELGLEAKLISVDNTQVYVAENDQSIVVAFRGSEAPTTLDGLKDWLLTNANNYLILPEGRAGTDFAAAGVGARFHRGFLDALEMVWEPLLAAVDQAQKAKERPLWVTGHSLGGALALLAAWRLQRNFLAVQEIVTFGAPMIGNEAASQGLRAGILGQDLPVRRPGRPGAAPPLGEPARQRLQPLPERSGPERRRGRRRRRAVRVALKQAAGTAAEGEHSTPPMVDQVWEMVKGRIASHMIANYQARVEAKCKELG